MITDAGSVPPVVPARMLNEHVYCPRLAYLEWVDQGFRDSDDTVEGTFAHRRVDKPRGTGPTEPQAEGDKPPVPSSSVWLTSERLGLTAKLDLIEADGDRVVPVEYKRGTPKSSTEPLWEPELVQMCAQVLLLRDAGYEVEHAVVYFAGSRSRHRIEIDQPLIDRTQAAAAQLRANAARDRAPPPLVDSPKCPRCSLVGICLPDETAYLTGQRTEPPRRLIAADPSARPLYLTEQGSRLTKRKGRAVLLDAAGDEQASRRLIDISHVSVYGNATVRSALLRELFDAGVPTLWFTYGGWFKGYAHASSAGNVELRMRQHRAAMIGAPELAAAFVAGKIRNARTLLRRNRPHHWKQPLAQLAELGRRAAQERSLESLLGIEGTAARIYFGHFDHLFAEQRRLPFAMDGRNRRPPTDPTNAMLSFVYSMLIKDTTVALLAAGLEPFVGFYHRPRFGRPALALDIAEEFRPLIGDSVVVRAVNNGEVTNSDFVARAGAVSLTKGGRRKLIASYERRMAEELRHPVFRYRASYRRTLEIQARMLAGVLLGELPEYRPLTTR